MNVLNPATRGSCPVTHGFTPFEGDYVSNPYPFFKQLREEAPVAYSPEYDLFLVTRFEDIVSVFKNRETFSSANASAPFSPICEAAQAILSANFKRKPTFNNADPPRHTAMRSAAAKVLTPRRWKAVEPLLRTYLDDRLARIADQEVVDIGAQVVFPTTSYAGFALLGFPQEDTELLQSWCGKRVLLTYGQLSDEDQILAAQQLVDFWRYVHDFVRMRETNPADDFTSEVLEVARNSNGAVTVEDVDSMVYSLSLAAHETTANALLNGINQLMLHRDAWEDLLADRSLVPGAVEELLRFDSPTVTHRRIAKIDTEIGGVPVPAGATVMLMLGAGNHDPERFENPEEVDIRRKNAIEHLAFGKNWHFCLGAPLARIEYRIVLERLLETMPDMTLAQEKPVEYIPLVLFRGPYGLNVRPNLKA
ncbi:MAG: cytochrome [Alphaproteobacteria bacterium]|nr:cytochrome [Alphaproteobacteria bacterium]